MILEKETLIKVEGGGILSGTVLNALIKGISTVLDLGRSLGTAIRRLTSGNVCPVKVQ